MTIEKISWPNSLKVCGYQTRYLWLFRQTHYRLIYATRLCFVVSFMITFLVGFGTRDPVWPHTFVSPFTDSRGAVVSYWPKYVHEVLVKRLGLSLPRKSVVRLTDRPEMTLDIFRWRKTTTRQQQRNGVIITYHLDYFCNLITNNFCVKFSKFCLLSEPIFDQWTYPSLSFGRVHF